MNDIKITATPLNSFVKESFDILLQAIGSEPFVFVSNPGNYGDSLIREGALQLFHDANLSFFPLFHNEYSILSDLETSKNKTKYRTLVYSGSGAWIHPYFNRTTRVVAHATTLFERVIVLPSTYSVHKELADFLQTHAHKNIIFFRCDDGISKQAIPTATLAPDTALYIHTVRLPITIPKDTGYFFRSDIESTQHRAIPPENLDLSLLGNETTDVSLFFHEIHQYHTIHTDRLHVGIAGFLLGKKVFLYDNSYHKNKSLYDTFFSQEKNIIFIP